ncbi:MAG: glycine cleavage system protein GcvH [Alphaproteobacteria bacterium]|nr:glycine cleavage system protein GcvH [Alphaproteobacteria bacterium]
MSAVRFTEDHEWIRTEGDVATVGITDYAQQQLGDVVYVELPQPGRALARGDEAAVVESVKAAAEVYAPVDGEVVEANGALEGDPGLVNRAAQAEGWFFRVKLASPAQLDALMDEAGYAKFVEGL